MVMTVQKDRPLIGIFWNALIEMGMDVLMIKSGRPLVVPPISDDNGTAIKTGRPEIPVTGQPGRPVTGIDLHLNSEPNY